MYICGWIWGVDSVQLFNDPVDVGNLVSRSPAISKTSLNIWKFIVHILLMPGLENFESITLLASEMSTIVW